MSGSPIAELVAGVRRELELARASEEQREVELTAAERYARDPLAWIDETPVWVASKFGDGGRTRPVRFRLFPSQRQTIEDWIDLDHLAQTGELRFRNFLSEKSRQIGETWAFAVILTWLLHFHRGKLGLAMHRKGAEIDDGGARSTVKSLFGKIRYIDQRLGSPNGLPAPESRRRLPGLGRLAFRPFSRDPAKVENLDNGHVLIGEGQIDDPGRGATLDYALVDEAPFVEHGERVHAALDEACPDGKAYFGTVNGDDNFHARLCDEKPKGYRYRRLHWSDHPVYGRGKHTAALVDEQTGETLDPGLDGCELCAGTLAGLTWDPENPRAHRYPGRLASPWYDERVIGKTDEQVANELDIDRERALGGRVYPEFQTGRHVIAGGIDWQEEFEYRLRLGWDFGLDTTAVTVCADMPAEFLILGLLEVGDDHGTTATPELVSRALRDYLADLGVPRDRLTPEWTRRIVCFGDPAGASRDQATARPLVSDYRRQGFVIQKPPRRLTSRVDAGIRAVKRLLLGHPKPLRVCGLNGEAFARHVRNYVWPTDERGRRRPGVTKPLDGEHGHACDAVRYLVVALFGAPDEPHAPRGRTDTPEQPDELPGRRTRRDSPRRRRERGVNTDLRYGMSG